MKAIVDENTCTGCGLCADICPAVFEMNGELAKVKVDPVPSGEEETCQDAADSCPVNAISIES